MRIKKKVSPAFEDFIFNWDYETYLEVGSYGSGKSYHVAFKIILKLLEEKRKALVVRNVYATIQESCYDLFCEILDDMGLLTTSPAEFRRRQNRVLASKSPFSFTFPNGSKVIFKGMDDSEKVKSMNGVSIVWIEEASEITPGGYQELLGRVRTPNTSMHFFLSCNPVGRENWVYERFFKHVDEQGEEHVIVDEKDFYERGVLVKDGVYYHHTTCDDNPWLPWRYVKRLDELKDYDYHLYMVARWGRFGTTGMRVLPQFVVQRDVNKVMSSVQRLGPENMYFGFDFGFEESFNAVISMSVDPDKQYLYIWDEIYMNHVTDPDFANLDEMQVLKRRVSQMYDAGLPNGIIVADNEDPKAIAYYRQQGFRMRPCRNKFAGSRLSNTRKIKRFRKIICSPRCKNVVRELRDLTYKKDSKGNVIHDQFNIDPHSFSAIWYALDMVTVADLKDARQYNSKKGDGGNGRQQRRRA